MTPQHTGKLDISLPGLDLDDGIQRLGGDTELYVEMLGEYVQDLGDFSTEFLELLEKDDFETARRSAHSLKGASGNIAAVTLYDAAKDLEMACVTQDKNQILPLVQPVAQALEEVVVSAGKLADHFNGPESQPVLPPSNPSQPMDKVALSELFGELAGHLKVSDPVASDTCMREIKKLASGAMPTEDLASLEGQIRQYDFEAAEKTLEQLAQWLAS
jgi:two-component system, sensor histidine kinase and response regulator